MNSFQRQNKLGVEAQEIVKAHLEARGNIVEDVSLDKDFQKKDIDFLVRKPVQSGSIDTPIAALEVKLDNNLFTTGNIFFEAGFQRGNFYSAGWLKYCEADYIAYYSKRDKHGIIIDFNKAKELLPTLGITKHFYDRYDNKDGVAILLKLEIARENNIIIYEWRD